MGDGSPRPQESHITSEHKFWISNKKGQEKIH